MQLDAKMRIIENGSMLKT